MTEAPQTSSGTAPLSVAQEALWYMSLLAPNLTRYNETISIRKDGPLDLEAFREAFNEIVRRHEIWRTSFDTVDREPVQVAHPAPRFDLPVIDLSHLTPDQAERRAVALAAEMSGVPYDLRRGPLLRLRLIRFPTDQHRLYVALHHLVFDGVSVYRVVLPELVALYEAFSAGRPSPLPELQIQYEHYARWEREWIIGPGVARRLEYWREHLNGSPTLCLPHDHRRQPVARFYGGVVPLSISGQTVGRLRQVGQSVGATLFQVLAASWTLLLSRYSGQDDIVFATAADMRQRPEFESIIGYCLTPLVMRVDVSRDPPFTELIVRVRNELLDGLDHLVPFERVVRELPPVGASSANPVYQIMIGLEPLAVTPDPSWSIHQMESEIGAAMGDTKLDLELELDERPEGHISGRLIYDRDLFEGATAIRMAEHWSRLLDAVAADPGVPISTIPILTPAEEGRQLVEWNATATERPTVVVHDLVALGTAWHPHAPAVSAGDLTISYRELDRQANGVASRLRGAGVEPGEVVALCSEPSIDLVVGVLGVLKAGAAYLLLDPALSAEQLDVTIHDSGATVALVQTGSAARVCTSLAQMLPLGDADSSEAPESAASGGVVADASCCVQYGSRPSVGPAGVANRHASVVNLATAIAADLGIGPAATVLVLPSTLFYASVTELWSALGSGARIVLAPAEDAADGAALSRLIAAERVTHLHARPSTWQTLIDSGLRATRALRALSGGEPLSRSLADQILERCQVLWNAYGAMETAGYCTLGRVAPAGPITVGRPIANTRVYLLGAHNRPVPIGVTGELAIAGRGVAAGYLQRAAPVKQALQQHQFVEDPFGEGPMYRTQDRARWRSDGELEIVPAEPGP